MKRPRLSLCMIVKNEEDCMARCLGSVRDVVDEIVIVDTGSTDKTVEICRSFQARIETFPWNGSFSDARNYGIDKASGEWILWLDADEEVDPGNLHLLRGVPDTQDYDVMTIHLVNYYGDKVDPHLSTDIAHTRLFRRDKGIRFINKIHECLDIVGVQEDRIGHLKLKVHHYGYMDPIVEKKGKFERNLKMLEKQIEEEENVYWAHYYMASEYYRVKNYKEAFDRVNLSIAAFLKLNLLPPSMVYKLKYSILLSMGSFEGAWPGIQRAVALYPDYVDLRFFMGMVLYHLGKPEAALEAFEECIRMGEDQIDHLILRGVGTFQAWHYMGLCEQKLGREREALVYFLRALNVYPDYKPSRESVTELIEKGKKPDWEELSTYFSLEERTALQQLLCQL